MDTDTLVFYLRGRDEVKKRVLNMHAGRLCSSDVCLAELYYGANKSQQKIERLVRVERLRTLLPFIPLSSNEAKRFGALKSQLELSGQRLADADLMIASTALENNLIIVTGNAKHFNRIPGLKVENWINR